MATVAGDLLEVTYNHPTLGTGTLFPKAAEDTTLDLGGFRSGDDANMITSRGETIRQLNNARWSMEATIANDTVTREDLAKLNALAGDSQEADWTFTHISGTVYGGKGAPVGDIQANLNAGTFTLKVQGGGSLKNIV